MFTRSPVSRRLNQLSTAPRRFISSAKEGSVAQSKEFGKRERAQEEHFIRERDRIQLVKIKEQIAAKQAELEALKKEHEDLDKDLAKQSKD